MLQRDIRKTPLHAEMEEHFRRALEPAFGKLSSGSAPAPSPDGKTIVFVGSRVEKLEDPPVNRICLVDVDGGKIDEISGGPNSDRFPEWHPNGQSLAFLSDRKKKGRFQLFLFKRDRLGEATSAPEVEGTIEYFHWSPDGRRIVLGVAGLGADLADVEGSGTTPEKGEELPSWIPTVESGTEENHWRRLYLYDLESNTVKLVSPDTVNVWEATWCGPNQIAAIVSAAPEEDAWYSAHLALIELDSAKVRTLYESRWQLGVPAASPSGHRLAVIEALSSDRGVIAGDVLLLDPATGSTHVVDTNTVDVSHLVWQDGERLLFSGFRGLHTVVGEYDAADHKAKILWETDESCGSAHSASVRPLSDDAFVTVVDSFHRYPEICLIRSGNVTPLTSFSHEGSAYLRSDGSEIEEIAWTSGDELEIQGYLLKPAGNAPHPLIVNIHGGPIGTTRNHWLGPGVTTFLLRRGYAVLLPNPRGSTGRGREFARMVLEDIGGGELQDSLTGVDSLVERGVADPSRLGVMGGSHGGYMTAWMVTQTHRFRAAVAFSPITDWLSQHFTSNISAFDRLFLKADPTEMNTPYLERSPVVHAKKVKTPTLLTAGKQDRCTPEGQAVEFHRALRENGIETALVIYPEEGHGVRNLPTVMDFSTRAVDWFERHIHNGAAAKTDPREVGDATR